MANVDDNIFENKKIQTKATMWVTLALIAGSTILGVIYLFESRPEPTLAPPRITIETCSKLCGEPGVLYYDASICKCQEIKAPPGQKVEHMTCECAPTVVTEIKEVKKLQ